MVDDRYIEAVTADPPALPSRTVMRQRWEELAYFHWAYDPYVVQQLLPNGVTVDTYDGSAWVGLIPFEMRGIRVGPIPPVPLLSNFVEINVRTYITDPQGRRAVWFFSLDVPRLMVMAIARSTFGVPYCWSSTSHRVSLGATGQRHRYELRRRVPTAHRGAHANIEYHVGASLSDNDLDDFDHWMSARWALIASRFGRLRYGRVSHPRWPLCEVASWSVDENVIEATGLPKPVGQPHVRCSPGVPVELGWFERVSR